MPANNDFLSNFTSLWRHPRPTCHDLGHYYFLPSSVKKMPEEACKIWRRYASSFLSHGRKEERGRFPDGARVRPPRARRQRQFADLFVYPRLKAIVRPYLHATRLTGHRGVTPAVISWSSTNHSAHRRQTREAPGLSGHPVHPVPVPGPHVHPPAAAGTDIPKTGGREERRRGGGPGGRSQIHPEPPGCAPLGRSEYNNNNNNRSRKRSDVETNSKRHQIGRPTRNAKIVFGSDRNWAFRDQNCKKKNRKMGKSNIASENLHYLGNYLWY